LALYRDRRSWKQIQLTGRRQDFSWRHSAGDYLRLYNEALHTRRLPHKEQLWTK
jgi:glycogen synthase